MASIYRTGTEYTSNTLTISRGAVADIQSVGVYHTTDPNAIPEIDDFTTVELVDGIGDPDNPLARPGIVEAITKVGPRGGDVVLTQGVYQRYVLIVTADEDIIRRVDTLEIL